MSKASTLVLSASLAALTLNAVSAADEYQWEAGLAFSQNVDEDDFKIATILAHGAYHFAPVQLADHPWEEAAFLEHSMFADAALGLIKFSDSGLSASGLVLGAGFTYATPDFPMLFAAHITSAQAKDDDINFEIKSFEIEVEGGYWIMPDLLAGLRVNHEVTDVGAPDDETELQVTAFGKWVRSITAELAFNAEAELARKTYDDGVDKDANTILSLGGDLYFRQQYGVGLMLASETGDVDGAAGTTIGVRGSAWFTQNIGLRVALAKFAVKDSAYGVDDTTVSVDVVGRF